MKIVRVSPEVLTARCYGWHGGSKVPQVSLNEQELVKAQRNKMECDDRESRIKSHQQRVKAEEAVYIQEDV